MSYEIPGVDSLSRVIIPYSIQRKTPKWYKKIGELFNDQVKFRMDLVKTIINVSSNYSSFTRSRPL